MKGLSIPKPKGLLEWSILLGGAVLGGYIIKHVLSDHLAKAHFANSLNSIYSVHDSDLGNSMNSFVPTAHQKYSTLVHPMHHHHHGEFHHPSHRSFPDYTDRANALPTPFLEHNSPYDSFNRGANLSNIIDKAAYIQTYDGNSFGSP